MTPIRDQDKSREVSMIRPIGVIAAAWLSALVTGAGRDGLED
jgi:hypothetical protein